MPGPERTGGYGADWEGVAGGWDRSGDWSSAQSKEEIVSRRPAIRQASSLQL